MADRTDIPDGASVPSAAARIVRIAAHVAILALAGVLLKDILATEGVRRWPDQGFPLLVVAFAALTAGPALIRSVKMPSPDWGENLAGSLSRSNKMRLGLFAATWLVFGLVLPLVGFLVSATLAMTVSAVALARARPWLTFPIAAIIAVLIFIFFQRVLYVGLPLGPLDRLVIQSIPKG
ncbi:tripartite tricarboxylate transporter TctB family protein [Pseudooceanicola onchidii]|uniref:tripartite tricarboxylate transporter TctB family protein n=1 Tax=Pseudooceanicola onchidii TaxID=2562279 RepID=UPI0010AA7CC4|nr:tripartite tricarboxylate transporter TctB family protein [Pseudooceanicola onchidii]